MSFSSGWFNSTSDTTERDGTFAIFAVNVRMNIDYYSTSAIFNCFQILLIVIFKGKIQDFLIIQDTSNGERVQLFIHISFVFQSSEIGNVMHEQRENYINNLNSHNMFQYTNVLKITKKQLINLQMNSTMARTAHN